MARMNQINRAPLNQVQVVSRIPLLIGFLTGPIVWSIHELLSEILISAACSTGSDGFRHPMLGGIMAWQLILLLVGLVLAAVVAAAGVVAFRAWRRSRLGTAETGAHGGAEGRSGWMALAGVLVSTMFLFGIVEATLPIFWLSGCT